jgi:hypothetical protein
MKNILINFQALNIKIECFTNYKNVPDFRNFYQNLIPNFHIFPLTS